MNLQSGLFERSHSWQGDVPEPESDVFQRGKKKALDKLLPYTRSQSNEAACVVIKADGKQFFATGTSDAVEISFPAHLVVAHLHTHPQDHAHSAQDWNDFLWFASVEQSHVVAPTQTFSLHKPKEWRAEDHGLEAYFSSDIEPEPERAKERNRNRIEADYNEFVEQEFSRIGWSPEAEKKVREIVCHLMADKYGVKFRIGKQKQETS